MSSKLTSLLRKKKEVKCRTIDLVNGADVNDVSDCNGTERTVCDFNPFMIAVDPFLSGNTKVYRDPSCYWTF